MITSIYMFTFMFIMCTIKMLLLYPTSVHAFKMMTWHQYLACTSYPTSHIQLCIAWTIVNGGDWLGSPENIKGANKNAKIYVGRSTTLHNLLFCAHTLCMNYVTNRFLLASSSVRSKQLLCFVQGQGQKSEQKHTTKSIDEFHNHSPLLTMLEHNNRQ